MGAGFSQESPGFRFLQNHLAAITFLKPEWNELPVLSNTPRQSVRAKG